MSDLLWEVNTCCPWHRCSNTASPLCTEEGTGSPAVGQQWHCHPPVLAAPGVVLWALTQSRPCAKGQTRGCLTPAATRLRRGTRSALFAVL